MVALPLPSSTPMSPLICPAMGCSLSKSSGTATLVGKAAAQHNGLAKDLVRVPVGLLAAAFGELHVVADVGDIVEGDGSVGRCDLRSMTGAAGVLLVVDGAQLSVDVADEQSLVTGSREHDVEGAAGLEHALPRVCAGVFEQTWVQGLPGGIEGAVGDGEGAVGAVVDGKPIGVEPVVQAAIHVGRCCGDRNGGGLLAAGLLAGGFGFGKPADAGIEGGL